MTMINTNCPVPPACPCPGTRYTYKGLPALFGLLLVMAGASPAIFAQVETERLLFEPMPIPEDPADTLPLVPFATVLASLDTGPGDVSMPLSDRRQLENDIADYVTAIGDQESEEGPYSDSLYEDLFSAGNLSQQIGDHAQAMNFFTRAQAVIRINEGLETLRQLPVMTSMVESLHAQAKFRDADAMQQAIYALQQQAYGNRSTAIVPAMEEYGKWHMDAFMERSNILLNVDRMNVVRFMSDPGNYIHEYDPRDTPLMNLYQAQQTLLNAIDILVSNRQYFNPELLELERMLLTSYILSMHRENILYEPDFYLTRKKKKTGSRLNTNAMELMDSREYQLGQSSHERSVAFVRNNPERHGARLAEAMLEEADWHLLFERKVKAADEYRKVYAFFADKPELALEAAPVLYPEKPVILPTYLPAPNSREKLDIGSDEPVSFFGYYDVSFSVDKFGKAKRIRVLAKGGDVTSNMEIRLKQYLRKVLFRPTFADGQPDTGTRQLRYYIGL